MESRRTKSGKTSTPGWNRCDISDDFRENKAPANVPGLLFRFQLLAQSGHRLVRCMSAFGGEADIASCHHVPTSDRGRHMGGLGKGS